MKGNPIIEWEPAVSVPDGHRRPAPAEVPETLREEVSSFVVRQIFERDAQFFDG